MDPGDVYFRTFWTESTSPLRWRPALESEIVNGNTAVLALGELAQDLRSSGYLASAHEWRNATTHRFVVVHDPSVGDLRSCAAVVHVSMEEYRRATIETARFVRAALLYFVELVARREARNKSVLPLPLIVPTHHHVRGEE